MQREVQAYKRKADQEIRTKRSGDIIEKEKIPVVALSAISSTVGPEHIRYEVSPEFTLSQFNMILRK
jgi:hypothetical protein